MSIPNFTWVHPRLGVGTVWRGIRASGGWRCLPSLGETQCRRQAWPYSGVGQLGRVRGQAHGRHMAGTYGDLMGLAGRGLAGHLRIGTCHQYRHPVDEACCRRGGVAGAEPPHKGGPNRPDRPNARREGRGESSEKHQFMCRQLESEVTVAWFLPEVYESSPPFWDAPFHF